jgi:hypothetical protein
MTQICCPVCETTAEPAAQVGAIAVCAFCGASLHVEDGGSRRATAADTTSLTAAELQTLRTSRKRSR